MVKTKKLYLIGIDSAPLWIIDKLSKRTGMGGFRLFFDHGFLDEIESTVPPVTSTAWPTIYTGLEPKEHRIIDFSTINHDYSKELTYYDAGRYPPFWDVLASKGLKSLVITPAVALQKSRHSNVDMLTGWPLQARFSSGRIEEISKKFKYDGEPDIGNSLNTGRITLEEATRIYTDSIKRRADLSKYLIERNDYDFAFICFTETDRIQHYSLNLDNWKDYVAPLYEEISTFISYIDSRIRKKRENAAVMVVSDHGAQPVAHKFLSNSWMVHNNYAALKENVYNRDIETEPGAVSKVKRRIINHLVESRFRRQIYEKMPKSLKKVGEKMVEESHDYEYKGKYIHITETDFDMRRTKAFCSISSGPVGMVLINDSRFSSPGIKDSERDSLKAKLIKSIKNIEDDKGRRLMDFVEDGNRYFPRNNHITPDVVFGLKEGYTTDYSGYSKGSALVDPEINRRGEHTSFGIFGVKSYNGKIAIKHKGLKLADVNPIILKYFGI